MVTPITGPTTNVVAVGGFSTTQFYDLKVSRRQSRPYNLPLSHVSAQITTRLNYSNPTANPIYGIYQSLATSGLPPSSATYYLAPVANAFGTAYNAAYARFENKIRDGTSAEMGMNLGESRESLKMIVTRMRSIVDIAKAIKRGRLGDLYDALAVPAKPGKKLRPAKDVANAMLEYRFGWQPMIQDIYNALDVLQGPIPNGVFSKSARADVGFEGTFGTWPTSLNANLIVRLGANVTITNPNLWLMNQLGLVNPAQVAWELLPGSFLVGWFSNVSQILGAYTAFAGIHLTECYISRRIDFSGHNWSNGWYGDMSYDAKGFRFQRDAVATFPIPDFTLFLPDHKGLAGKAVSLAAMATQMLTK